METECVVESDKMVVEGVDGVVVQVDGKEGHGYAWCAEGLVTIPLSLLDGPDDLGPGRPLRLWASRDAVDEDWLASDLVLLPAIADIVAPAFGLVSRTDTGLPFLHSPAFPHRVFAPAFAAPNPADAFNLRDLLSRRVHFLSIPNPKPGYHNRFIIALHPESPACHAFNGKDAGAAAHWNHPPAPPAPLFSSLPSSTTSYGTRNVYDELRDEHHDELEVRDAYITYIRSTHGYLRSRERGMVKFEASALLKRSISELCPGTAVCAVIVPLQALEDIHQPTWRALSVIPLEPLHFHEDITTGTGNLILGKKTYGMLRNSEDQKIFVPGWAGVNNELGEGWQVPELAACPIHYLAMPNPKSQYRGEPFALCAHPVGAHCQGGHELRHWLGSPFYRSRTSLSSLQDGDDSAFAPPRLPSLVPALPDLPLPLNPDSLDYERLKCSLQVATALHLPEFVSILNRCPNLFHWAFFTNLPRPEPFPTLPDELAVLRQAQLY